MPGSCFNDNIELENHVMELLEKELFFDKQKYMRENNIDYDNIPKYR